MAPVPTPTLKSCLGGKLQGGTGWRTVALSNVLGLVLTKVGAFVSALYAWSHGIAVDVGSVQGKDTFPSI